MASSSPGTGYAKRYAFTPASALIARIEQSADPSVVKPFIDIESASGSVYRFRRINDPVGLRATSRNFLFLKTANDGAEVVSVGTAGNLIRAGEVWRPVVEEHDANAIFVRLNVSLRVWASEHDDIVEGQRPAMVVTHLE